MTIAFPPKPVYPEAIDSDFTLYLVYNTTESILAVDNEPWSSEIEIVPVGANEPEIWADNGFGNIDGELFYYDSVEKDSNGKIFKFKRLNRNLGGKKTHFVKANSKDCQVRGFVVAEHHNQLAEAIFQVENFIGVNFDDDVTTLDYRIRCLRAVPLCLDDYNCPVVTFNFEALSVEEGEDSACQGISYAFDIEIEGTFNSFVLDFGDGTTTSDDLTGTHVYPVDVIPDPVITVSNPTCQICATPPNRTLSDKICAPEQDTPFLIPLPVLPDFPDINTPDINIDQPFDLPPTIFPCINLSVPSFPNLSVNIPFPDFGINVPSVISFVPPIPDTINISPVNLPTFIQFGPIDVNVPSLIQFGPINIPTLIQFGPLNFPTLIQFGPVNLPTLVQFGPVNVPTTIQFGPANVPTLIRFDNLPSCLPTLIQFGPTNLPTLIQFSPISLPSVNFGVAPTISVEWGTPPTISANVTVSCPSCTGTPMRAQTVDDMFAAAESSGAEDFSDPVLDVQWDVDSIGLPQDIKIIAPDKMPEIMVVHDLPDKISLDVPKIPPIKVEHDIPDTIKVKTDRWPTSIKLDAPKSIKLDTSDIEPIALSLPKELPVFKLEAIGIPDTIQVTGIPDTIQVVHDLPQSIDLVLPENPKVELVYNGPPIDMKIDINDVLGGDEDEDHPCVMIVPCKPKK